MSEAKHVSKQRRHAVRRRANGKCREGGCDAYTNDAIRCEKHAAAWAEYMRKWRENRGKDA